MLPKIRLKRDPPVHITSELKAYWPFFLSDNDEMKKRMYSTIVVVGGGVAKFQGAESWIKYAVWTQMPPAFRLALETMDVICSPKVRGSI